jgi:predicted membrane protein (TIGR00267 family)
MDGLVKFLQRVSFLLRITRTHGIIRRYFVVNGFDGALTMLGLILGFLLGAPAELPVIISACLGAAIALGISGVSSAYISEAAERRRDLTRLEEAMVADLQDSTHASAVRWVPMLIAFVNGAAPLVISLLIITPLWLTTAGVALPLPPLHAAIVVALILIFLLGVFLGQIAGISWIRSGIKTLLVALITGLLIYLFVGR